MKQTLVDQQVGPRTAVAHTLPATTRLWEVDTVRGIAVILMVLYHFMWDLSMFGIYRTDMRFGPWQAVARGIGTTFIFLLGLSLTLSYQRGRVGKTRFSFSSNLRRGLLIFGCGLIVSLATYVFDPATFVIFGILHLLGAALILAHPFLFVDWRISLIAGLLLIGAGLFVDRFDAATPWLTWLGIEQAGRYMSDYYPLLPWFGVALLGMSAGFTLYPKGERRFPLPDLNNLAPVRGLRFLGRHSLIIYLLHQPIMLGVLFALRAQGFI